MRHRFALLTSAFAFLAVTAMSAAPTVTYVLTSGQRVTGVLVYHHGVEMTLSVNGREQNFRYEDIAVVEFAQGMPGPGELNQLANSRSPAELMRDMIVMRDGRVIHGKLHDIVDDAETISFDAGPGNRQRIASRDIARLYFNGNAARDVYGQGGGMQAAPMPRQANQLPPQQQAQPLNGTTFEVHANQEWTATGIGVRQGQVVRFQVSGEIKLNREGYMVATAAGITPPSYDGKAPVPQALVGAIIGRIGRGGRPFAIGNLPTVTMPSAGELFLGINDSNVKDNSGFFTVVINTGR